MLRCIILVLLGLIASHAAISKGHNPPTTKASHQKNMREEMRDLGFEFAAGNCFPQAIPAHWSQKIVEEFQTVAKYYQKIYYFDQHGEHRVTLGIRDNMYSLEPTCFGRIVE